MKLYHFCAFYQDNENNSMHYFDGTISADGDLSNYREYDKLKERIAANMMPRRDGKDIVLTSLSLVR